MGEHGTFIPIEFGSSKQKPVANSTPMAETVAGANLVQNHLLFATELQQILDVFFGVEKVANWNDLSPGRIPLLVDAKELERQSVQPIQKSITSLCTALARDQVTWLSQRYFLQLRWLEGAFNPSDIGTKQHKIISVLRQLCGTVLCHIQARDEWVKTQKQDLMVLELITKVFERISMEHNEEHPDIDWHLRIMWEISDPVFKAVQ